MSQWSECFVGFMLLGIGLWASRQTWLLHHQGMVAPSTPKLPSFELEILVPCRALTAGGLLRASSLTTVHAYAYVSVCG